MDILSSLNKIDSLIAKNIIEKLESGTATNRDLKAAIDYLKHHNHSVDKSLGNTSRLVSEDITKQLENFA